MASSTVAESRSSAAPRRPEASRIFRPARSWRLSSWSSRAQRARSCSAASTRRRSVLAATRWAVTTGGRGARGERLEQPLLVGREPALAVGAVERGQHADGLVAVAQRDQEAGRRADLPRECASQPGRLAGEPLVALGAAGRRGDQAAVDGQAPAEQVARDRAGDGAHDEVVLVKQGDDHDARLDECRPRLVTSSRTRSRSVSAPSARAIDIVASSAATVRSSSSRRSRCPR